MRHTKRQGILSFPHPGALINQNIPYREFFTFKGHENEGGKNVLMKTFRTCKQT